MKKLYILILLAGLLFIAACNSDSEEVSADGAEEDVTSEDQENEKVEDEEMSEDPVETEVVEEQPTEIELYSEIRESMLNLGNTTETVDGSGNQSYVFDVLVDGMVKFTSTNTGDSNFMIHIEDGVTGERIGSAANHIGDYEGEQYVPLSEGEYILQVKSDGNWVVDIGQPFITELTNDKAFQGSGSQTVGPLTFDSNRIELVADHDGDSNFMVHILGVYGDRETTAFNEIGVYEGNHITTVFDSMVYYIDVSADGNWNIEVID